MKNFKSFEGHIIDVEGVDGVGKTTQVTLLVATLEQLGLTVSMMDFPNYEDPHTGGVIGKALHGEYGDFRQIHPVIAFLPYAVDRFSRKKEIKQALRNGMLVTNRYTPSNLAYQAAKLPQGQWEEIIHHMEVVEYDELGIPTPTAVLYLSAPISVAQAQLAERDEAEAGSVRGKRDLHERDYAYQERVDDVYRMLAEKRSSWSVVECAEDGEMLSKEEIHKRVLIALSNM